MRNENYMGELKFRNTLMEDGVTLNELLNTADPSEYRILYLYFPVLEYYLIIDIDSTIVCRMMVIENHYHSTTTHKLYMDKSKHPDLINLDNEDILKRLLKPLPISFILDQLMNEKVYLLSSPIEILSGFDNIDELEEELYVNNVISNIDNEIKEYIKILEGLEGDNNV